ncbi:MAG: hypothetical protein DRZ80_06785 [Thermoprotei archaeon]|nr:MAG: hypothetical protein DRZ80_06785 [Thermoprotei archaeon]
MAITIGEHQLKLILDRLDMVRVELLRLRAMLLPEEELDEKEKEELEEARKEIKEGYGVNLKDLIEELG